MEERTWKNRIILLLIFLFLSLVPIMLGHGELVGKSEWCLNYGTINKTNVWKGLGINMNDSEKLIIAIDALKQIDWLEENSPSTISVRHMFERAQEIARETLKLIKEEE